MVERADGVDGVAPWSSPADTGVPSGLTATSASGAGGGMGASDDDVSSGTAGSSAGTA